MTPENRVLSPNILELMDQIRKSQSGVDRVAAFPWGKGTIILAINGGEGKTTISYQENESLISFEGDYRITSSKSTQTS